MKINHHGFEKYLQARGAATQTIKLYMGRLGMISKIVSDVSNPVLCAEEIDKASMIKKSAKPLYKIVLRKYYSYLGRNDWKDMIEVGKRGGQNIHYFTEGQIKRLFDACQDLEERFIISFYFFTGTRLSIGLNIKLQDINMEESKIDVPSDIEGNKAKMTYSIYFSEDLKPILNQWIKAHKLKQGDYLMKPLKGRWKYPKDGINSIFKRIGKRAGLPSWISPHKIRHSVATQMMNKGIDIRTIQRNLGHKNIQTTSIYTHLSDEQRANHVKEFYGKFKR